MVMESSTQIRGIAEVAHDVRMVVKHTFLELVEDERDARFAQTSRRRSTSEPRSYSNHMCDKLDRKSTASTQANDTDDDSELMLSDEEEACTPLTPLAAPPGVFAQPVAGGAQLVPVCVAFVPFFQQPVWKKSSRSARRRRARAMNRWFRYNTQTGEQEALDDDDSEFDDDWQMPEGTDMEFPEVDAESWPMPSSPYEVHDKKSIKA